ncbi:MAG: hypothetical protein II625_10005 [Bacilli bacterium]|nr:hypothetical protein [Bacilli bacterium]
MQTIKLSNIELLSELESGKHTPKKVAEILREINLRIDLDMINFKGKENKFLYIYMLLCNKLDSVDYLNSLLKKEEFIKSIDIAGINGSTILFLTDKCTKPRTVLLRNSNNIKNSITKNDELFSSYDFLDNLSKEEILILREDQDIDNSLITNGLRFDALKPETTELLMRDISLFANYDIKTIRAFANGYKEIKDIANNNKFLGIYLNKLDDDFKEENKILKKITIKQVKELKKGMSDLALLNLVKDASPTVQESLLNDKKVEKLLVNCNNLNVLERLPKDYLIKLLTEKENLLSGINLMMLRNLNKQELSKIAKNNKHFYSELVDKITQNDTIDYKPFITALPEELLKDLSNKHLDSFNFEVLKKLLDSNKSFFKDQILSNKKVSNYLINRDNKEELIELLEDSDFNNEEKIRLLCNCDEVKSTENICAVLYTIPENLRLPIYKDEYLRNLLLGEKSFKLDTYTTKYLLNNYKETLDKPVSLLINLMLTADNRFAEELLSSEDILDKVFKDGSKEPELLKKLLSAKPKLLPFFKDSRIKQYYTADLLTSLKDVLDPNEMNNICSNEVIANIYKDPELINVYKKLLNNNSYLLNTFNFNFISENTKDLKLAILDKYTKYPDIQEYIVEISKKYPLTNEFLNQLYYATEELNFEETVPEILNVFKQSVEGTNRKRVGNLVKMLQVAKPSELTKTNFAKLINYLLYFVPRFNNVKPCLVKTPITFNEILKYNATVNEALTQAIKKGQNVRENFLLKHFRLTSEESLNIINKYSIERLNNEIYPSEYVFLSDLNKVFNTDEESLMAMDSKYHVSTMYDSFYFEEKIRKAFGKIYNFEIRSKTYANKPFIVNIFGKELKIYTCPSDFLFLISNIDITEEYEKTNSFLLGWHNTVNKLNGIHASLISNDNLHLAKDITFGFNGVLENGIKEISPYYKKATKFMTPRELIDNTRDINNRILLDKYAIRPNFNNSNLPNIEPDYILVDAKRLEDKNYLEKISRASLEFKTKRNKEGLPIIAVDERRISDLELSKINSVFTKYQKNHDMTLLHFIITKINNNHTAYRTLNNNLAQKFDISIVLNAVKERIKNSNSISEIEYIENIFREEENKYKYLIKDYSNEEEIKELARVISNRIDELNK